MTRILASNRLVALAGLTLLVLRPIDSPAEGSGPLDPLPDLVGLWEGTLTYRDYRSDRDVTLPARVENRMSQSGTVLVSEVAFTDPGWIVRSTQLTSISGNGGEYHTVGTSGGTFEQESLRIENFLEEGDNAWTIVLLGSGMDNDRSADLRVTHSLESGTFVSTKEVRYPDESPSEWFVRNRLSLERASVSTTQLEGTWKVDLRPTPDAEPYFQNFVVETDGSDFAVEFYGTQAANIRTNVDWGVPAIAFTTEDDSGVYHTSARLVDGTLQGKTHSLGRGFLALWTAQRVE